MLRPVDLRGKGDGVVFAFEEPTGLTFHPPEKARRGGDDILPSASFFFLCESKFKKKGRVGRGMASLAGGTKDNRSGSGRASFSSSIILGGVICAVSTIYGGEDDD